MSLTRPATRRPGLMDGVAARSARGGPSYRADIDGLRGVSVLAVVAFHAFPRLLVGGYVGVDVFFTISGYLIPSIVLRSLADERFSFGEFYGRRVRRIFPALGVVLAACLLCGWFTLDARDYAELGKQAAGGAAFVANLVFFTESGYFDTGASTKPLLHLWSLGVEEQFYIVWPPVLALLWRVRSRALLPLTVLAVATLSFGLDAVLVDVRPAAAFFLPVTRVWEILLGAALAAGPADWLDSPKARDGASILGVVGILVAVLLFDGPLAFRALVPTVGALLLIAAGPTALFNRTILRRRALVGIGLVSYPLYLWHWPALVFLQLTSPAPPSAGVRLAAVAGSGVLAWLTYRFVERPLRFGPRGSLKVTALCLVMLALASVGAAAYLRHGFESRRANHGMAGQYGSEALYRYGSCFIDSEGIETLFRVSTVRGPFPDMCDGDRSTFAREPLVLLWGDSHAAALYPGLLAAEGRHPFRIAQYTSTLCAPVVGMSRKKSCGAINDLVLSKIDALKPDRVILAAYWAHYYGRQGWDVMDYAALAQTIALLKEKGVADVVVVGNLPGFATDQPKLGAQEFIPNVKDRTYSDFQWPIVDSEVRVGDVIAHTSARFASPLALLCNADGCLMSTDPARLVPLAWDYGHLTKEGSIYLERAAHLGL